MGDNMGLLLGSALGAFGATVVKGIASRKPNGMRSDSVRDFRTFEQDEAAKLNPVGRDRLLPAAPPCARNDGFLLLCSWG